MATAGIIIIPLPEKLLAVEEQLKNSHGIVETQRTPDNSSLVAVVELEAEKLSDYLKSLEDLPDVASLTIAYANYEEDYERGYEPVAPKEEKKKKKYHLELDDEICE